MQPSWQRVITVVRGQSCWWTTCGVRAGECGEISWQEWIRPWELAGDCRHASQRDNYAMKEKCLVEWNNRESWANSCRASGTSWTRGKCLPVASRRSFEVKGGHALSLHTWEGFSEATERHFLFAGSLPLQISLFAEFSICEGSWNGRPADTEGPLYSFWDVSTRTRQYSRCSLTIDLYNGVKVLAILFSSL